MEGSERLPYQLPTRGVALRFQGLRELGPVPDRPPIPREPVTNVSPPTVIEGELPFLSISEAGRLLRTRELSPVELTRALLARIERLNPLLNAYITVTGDLAMDQAKQAEDEIVRGNYRGGLHGIPVCLKDHIATAGVPTTGGTAALADWIPSEDATVWRRLKEAGAVLLGKTGMHELGAGTTNVNPFYGTTLNPWNTAYITGGSSGGCAAAVAGHLCLAAIGNDSGGSIRIPAALCGIVGIKPTYGLVSTQGVLFLSWTNGHLGPMTKTVEDAAIVLNAIAGYEPGDQLSTPKKPEDFTHQLGGDLRGLRLAVPTNYFWEFESQTSSDGASPNGLDPEVARAVRAGMGLLQELGATVEEVEFEGLEQLLGGQGAAMVVERSFFFGELPTERLERFSSQYRDGLLRGRKVKAFEYLGNLESVERIQQALSEALAEFDGMVCPTTPLVAPTIASVTQTGTARGSAASSLARYCSPFNRSGHPALSVPCGFTENGLPIGMMIAAKHFADATVLRVASVYEQATEWHVRRASLP